MPLLAPTLPALGQPDILWITQFGGADYDVAYALAPDDAGGSYIAGTTASNLARPLKGGSDLFVARHDGNGTQAWVVQLGSDGDDACLTLAPDGAGGVFAAGFTDHDGFLCRFDVAGDTVWFLPFGTAAADVAVDLSPDGAGGVFLVGTTGGSLAGQSAGQDDVFLARFDGDGTLTWATQFGEAGNDRAGAMIPDGAGGVFITGGTAGSLGGPNAGGDDIFVARYDGAGNRLWIAQFGSDADESGAGLAQNADGGVFIGGRTWGSLGEPNLGTSDAFLARCDGKGELLWVTQFGTASLDNAPALAPDGSGGALQAGHTSGDLAGPNAGGQDAFIVGHDADGNVTTLFQFGQDSYDEAFAIVPDGRNGILVAGSTTGTLGGPNAGMDDAYLARISLACPADLDASGSLDLFDFLAFTNLFNAGDPAADCDADGQFTLFDFLCFTNAFNAGC